MDSSSNLNAIGTIPTEEQKANSRSGAVITNMEVIHKIESEDNRSSRNGTPRDQGEF